MRGLVLKVEPFASIARASPSFAEEPRKMRRGTADSIAAVGMLEFEMSDQGICTTGSLQSLDSGAIGERALVTAVERKLRSLHEADGRLVTFDGHKDLEMLRMASLRHRNFSIASAVTWQEDRRDSHDDVSLMLSPCRSLSGAGLWEIAVSLGAAGRRNTSRQRCPARPERIAADLAVTRTMVIYLHLLAERHRNIRPLAVGVFHLSEMIAAKVRTSPHLEATLRAELFESFAPIVF